MRYSDDEPTPEQIIDSIIACLDEDLQRQKIDDPIERVLSAYPLPPDLPRSHRT